MNDQEIEYFLIYLKHQVDTLGSKDVNHWRKGHISYQVMLEIDRQLLALEIKKNNQSREF